MSRMMEQSDGVYRGSFITDKKSGEWLKAHILKAVATSYTVDTKTGVILAGHSHWTQDAMSSQYFDASKELGYASQRLETCPQVITFDPIVLKRVKVWAHRLCRKVRKQRERNKKDTRLYITDTVLESISTIKAVGWDLSSAYSLKDAEFAKALVNRFGMDVIHQTPFTPLIKKKTGVATDVYKELISGIADSRFTNLDGQQLYLEMFKSDTLEEAKSRLPTLTIEIPMTTTMKKPKKQPEQKDEKKEERQKRKVLRNIEAAKKRRAEEDEIVQRVLQLLFERVITHYYHVQCATGSPKKKTITWSTKVEEID